MCATYAPRDPIGEFWRGEITLRELRVLVDGLPPDSAMHRRYPNAQGWDHSEYLLADVADTIKGLFNLTMAVNSESGRYEPPPLVDRPGDAERHEAEERQRARHADSVRSLLAQLLPPERR